MDQGLERIPELPTILGIVAPVPTLDEDIAPVLSTGPSSPHLQEMGPVGGVGHPIDDGLAHDSSLPASGQVGIVGAMDSRPRIDGILGVVSCQ